MKKLVLALLGVCCAVMIVPAQEVVSADTIKAVPAYATVDQQPVAQEVEPAKEVKEFRGRRGYFNIGYAWEKLEAADFPSENESEMAFFLTWGKTFYLHKKPIANMLKIGLDFTWTDITYAKYEVENLVEESSDFMGVTFPTFYVEKSDMHRMDYGIGPVCNGKSCECIVRKCLFPLRADFCHEHVSLRWRLGYGVRLCLVVCNGCCCFV